MSSADRVTFRATHVQEQLLRAALMSDAPALDAWEKWNAAININTIDPGSKRLLPLLYVNLKSLGIDHPLMQTFKGLYRRTWYENQLLFRTVSTLLRSLSEANIETLLLKGVALTQLYYRDLGLRPMTDADVLVPVKSASKAIRVVIAASFNPVQHRSVPIERLTESEIYKASIHSEHFVDSNGRGLDLHWHALYESLHTDSDNDFWDSAVPLEFQGVRTSAFNPADQLLHVCCHGVAWNPVAPIRWVADAAMILRSSPHIDWDRLLMQTEKHRLTLEMKASLSYLASVVDAPVPSEVLRALGEARVRKADVVWYRVKTERSPYGSLDRFLWLVRTYLRSGRRPLRGQRKVGFARYLQHLWGVDRVWQVPLYATSAAFLRLRRWSRV